MDRSDTYSNHTAVLLCNNIILPTYFPPLWVIVFVLVRRLAMYYSEVIRLQ